jgi:alpha-D-ribose 1-methylphosphonate 5-triphosphate synthase subunit PhnH
MSHHSLGFDRFPFVLTLLSSIACTQAPRTVEIHAKDYTFTAPATLPAGNAVFRFINDGSVLHEVQLFQFRKRTSPERAATLLAAGPLADSAYAGSGAVLITAPGTAAREQVIIPLARGDVYGLLCEFRNGDSLPRHSAMGMWAVLRVE